MKKNIVKIVLDTLMAILLFTLYNKSVISIRYHEIAGLGVCGLFIIHKGLNWNWITGVSKRLFSKQLPIRARLYYIIDFFLLICFIFIALSGIMISKIFQISGGGGAFWKLGHFFSSAVALILVGVHIGLHWSFIKKMFGKVIKLPRAIAKPVGIALLSVIVIYGGYNMATTSFRRWLTAPFTVSSMGRMPQNGERPQIGERYQKGEWPQNGERPQNGKRPQNGEMPQNGERPQRLQRPDESNMQFDDSTGENRPARPNGGKNRGGSRGNASLNFTRILDVMASFGSIIVTFAAATAIIDKLLNRKKTVTHPQN